MVRKYREYGFIRRVWVTYPRLVRADQGETYHKQISYVLKKGHVKSTINRRASMKALVRVDEV